MGDIPAVRGRVGVSKEADSPKQDDYVRNRILCRQRGEVIRKHTLFNKALTLLWILRRTLSLNQKAQPELFQVL